MKAHLRLHNRFAQAGSAWRAGAAALWGPLAVLALSFGTALGVVAIARLLLDGAPFSWTTVASAAIIAVVVSPWFVARGWLNRDRR